MGTLLGTHRNLTRRLAVCARRLRFGCFPKRASVSRAKRQFRVGNLSPDLPSIARMPPTSPRATVVPTVSFQDGSCPLRLRRTIPRRSTFQGTHTRTNELQRSRRQETRRDSLPKRQWHPPEFVKADVINEKVKVCPTARPMALRRPTLILPVEAIASFLVFVDVGSCADRKG